MKSRAGNEAVALKQNYENQGHIKYIFQKSRLFSFFHVLQCLNTLNTSHFVFFCPILKIDIYRRYRTVCLIILLKTDPSASTVAKLDYFQFQLER